MIRAMAMALIYGGIIGLTWFLLAPNHAVVAGITATFGYVTGWWSRDGWR